MNFADSIIIAQQTKWSFINSFTVEFSFSEKLRAISGFSDEDLNNLQLYIISIDTPQFTNNPIEVYTGDQWRYSNGRDELYRFTITFRDHSGMKLYRKFLKMYKETRLDYFDYVKINSIKIIKDSDYSDDFDEDIIELNDCLIESVSQVQFNNSTENQVAEFSVGFKTGKYSL